MSEALLDKACLVCIWEHRCLYKGITSFTLERTRNVLLVILNLVWLQEVLVDFLDRLLPSDIHDRCRGKSHVSLQSFRKLRSIVAVQMKALGYA